MKLKKWPRAIFRDQSDTHVRVTLCLQGKEDRLHYCVNLKIPKHRLVSTYSERTAAEDPEPKD